MWERPEDLSERADVDKAISTPPDQLAGTDVKENQEAAMKIQKAVEIEKVPISKSESESEDEEETPNKKLKTEGKMISILTELCFIYLYNCLLI